MGHYSKNKHILPSRWQGEQNCQIGPFSGFNIALYFVEYVLTGYFISASQDDIFAHQDGWFIDIKPLKAKSRYPASQVKLKST
ncbi:MAG: hypothetical protein KC422_15435 [Trueperaceae bacterium]|nr:hypothetical protein [Trueperaceae bacterium]